MGPTPTKGMRRGGIGVLINANPTTAMLRPVRSIATFFPLKSAGSHSWFAGLIIAYIVSCLLFIALIYAGIRCVRRTHSLVGMQRSLVCMTIYSMLALLVLASSRDIAVATEGRAVEEHGFVGQMGVMVRAVVLACMHAKQHRCSPLTHSHSFLLASSIGPRCT